MDGHLLIDGYNVLHAWPQARARLRRGWEAARAPVVAAGRLIHDVEQARVSIVFDGSRPHAAREETASETFQVLFAPAGLTADTVIERIVTRTPEATRCTVVTHDQLLAQTVLAAGGNHLTPEFLAQWVAQCEQRQSQQLQRRQRRSDADFGTRLDLD